MTREEAIDLLDNLIGTVEDNHNSDYDKALKMAIKSLEQEPCEDAISRKAVENITWEEPYSRDYLNVLTEIRDRVRALPSVYPKEKVGKWIPVSERLPKVEEKVLCQCRANIYEVLKLTVDGWYHDNNHCYMLEFVMAWMPLPKPYKAESSETKQGLAYADQDTMMPAT